MKTAILCVDDEKSILDSIKGQLKGNYGDKYVFEFAESGAEALEIIDEMDSGSVLLVVSDWLMPGMKGDEFLIKVHEKFPKIVKIMLTGQAEPASIEKAKKEANLYKLLAKPWTKEDLFKAIDDSLAGV